ncbi:MAG TPA: Ig-like domain-containing protein, partial [Roseiflexaceae bacterium]|nr:Ig-like domain-containing protein [Roseiflexaceae bacterium]
MRLLRLASRAWTGVLLLHTLLSVALLAARFVVLPLASEQPRLAAADPPAGATGVSPRATVSLRFSTPMNPPSVERALRVEPALPAALLWDAPRTTLTISPTEGLAPDTLYRVAVGEGAL